MTILPARTIITAQMDAGIMMKVITVITIAVIAVLATIMPQVTTEDMIIMKDISNGIIPIIHHALHTTIGLRIHTIITAQTDVITTMKILTDTIIVKIPVVIIITTQTLITHMAKGISSMTTTTIHPAIHTMTAILGRTITTVPMDVITMTRAITDIIGVQEATTITTTATIANTIRYTAITSATTDVITTPTCIGAMTDITTITTTTTTTTTINTGDTTTTTFITTTTPTILPQDAITTMTEHTTVPRIIMDITNTIIHRTTLVMSIMTDGMVPIIIAKMAVITTRIITGVMAIITTTMTITAIGTEIIGIVTVIGQDVTTTVPIITAQMRDVIITQTDIHGAIRVMT